MIRTTEPPECHVEKSPRPKDSYGSYGNIDEQL